MNLITFILFFSQDGLAGSGGPVVTPGDGTWIPWYISRRRR